VIQPPCRLPRLPGDASRNGSDLSKLTQAGPRRMSVRLGAYGRVNKSTLPRSSLHDRKATRWKKSYLERSREMSLIITSSRQPTSAPWRRPQRPLGLRPAWYGKRKSTSKSPTANPSSRTSLNPATLPFEGCRHSALRSGGNGSDFSQVSRSSPRLKSARLWACGRVIIPSVARPPFHARTRRHWP
jgi:hypothetical protein